MTRGEHGTYYGYVQGCRCDECRAANAAYQRDYRRRNPEVDRRRSLKGHRVATLAAQWVRRNEPAVWAQIQAQAAREVDAREASAQ